MCFILLWKNNLWFEFQKMTSVIRSISSKVDITKFCQIVQKAYRSGTEHKS